MASPAPQPRAPIAGIVAQVYGECQQGFQAAATPLPLDAVRDALARSGGDPSGLVDDRGDASPAGRCAELARRLQNAVGAARAALVRAVGAERALELANEVLTAAGQLLIVDDERRAALRGTGELNNLFARAMSAANRIDGTLYMAAADPEAAGPEDSLQARIRQAEDERRRAAEQERLRQERARPYRELRPRWDQAWERVLLWPEEQNRIGRKPDRAGFQEWASLWMELGGVVNELDRIEAEREKERPEAARPALVAQTPSRRPLARLNRAAASGEPALDAAVLLLLVCCEGGRERVANHLEQLHGDPDLRRCFGWFPYVRDCLWTPDPNPNGVPHVAEPPDGVSYDGFLRAGAAFGWKPLSAVLGGQPAAARATAGDPPPAEGVRTNSDAASELKAGQPGGAAATQEDRQAADDAEEGGQLAASLPVLLSAADLARRLGQPIPRVESFLRRYRDQYPDCYVTVDRDDRRRNEALYLYRTADVWTPLQEQRARWGG
jgi:hypothetical protein